MVHSSLSHRAAVGLTVLALVSLTAQLALAEQPNEHSRHDRRPVYQRRAFEWSHGHGGHRRHDSHFQFFAPQVSSGWFQRPYPYHLDYYRMKYGGSYAPYFGNLYGPPEVVTAPPYYGPYYGGYGEPGAYSDEGAYNGMPVQPQSYWNGVMREAPLDEVAPSREAATATNDEPPAPSP